MSDLTVMALDPGRSTGWVIVEFRHDQHHPMQLVGGTVEGELEEQLARLYDAYRRHEPDMIVIEDFIPDGTITGREATYSTLIIGALKGIMWANYGAPIILQPRSDKASLLNGTETQRYNALRKAGYTGTGHELDAITHALVYTKRLKHPATIQMLKHLTLVD